MHTWPRALTRTHTPIALTIGNFDGIHLGHQAMLACLKDTAKRLGLLACVMTFEPHPREFFSPDQAPPRLSSLREKLKYLIAAEIDRIYVNHFNYDFAQINPEYFITRMLNQELSVRWLLVGDDFRFGARRAGDLNLLQSLSGANNFSVEVMPSIIIEGQRISSTAVRQALACGDLSQAEKLLGRPYSISGRVVDGDKLGKQLGFPTANIHLKHNCPPLSGIFAVRVYGVTDSVPATPLPGVASLGVRPTTHQNGKPVLEVHLFDFNKEIYGRYLQVDFMHKLRNEVKFADIGTLIGQIEKDIVQAKNFFATAPIYSSSLCSAI